MTDQVGQAIVPCHDEELAKLIGKKKVAQLPLKKVCFVTILPKSEMWRESSQDLAVVNTEYSYDHSDLIFRKGIWQIIKWMLFAYVGMISSVGITGLLTFLLLGESVLAQIFSVFLCVAAFIGWGCLAWRSLNFFFRSLGDLYSLEEGVIRSGVGLLESAAVDFRKAVTVPLESIVCGLSHEDGAVRRLATDAVNQLSADFRLAIIHEYRKNFSPEVLAEISEGLPALEAEDDTDEDQSDYSSFRNWDSLLARHNPKPSSSAG
jgi:hypothetical protein